MKTIEHLKILFFTLRKMKEQKREYFRSGEYKWVLGAEIVNELKLCDPFQLVRDEPIMLFGIVVEIDYYNPKNIQLFEDITNKIAIEQEEQR